MSESSPNRGQNSRNQTTSPKKQNKAHIIQNEKIENEILRLQKLEGSVENKKKRKLKLDDDDPFSKVFLKGNEDAEFEEKGRAKAHKKVVKNITKNLQKFFMKKKSMNENEIEKKLASIDHESDKSSERGEINESEWKNEQYYQLPENVRTAIDTAKMKQKHSDFYNRLRLLNDKIHIFTSIFYNKVPKYQMNWYQQKQKLL